MTNFATVLNDLFNCEDKNEYIRSLCRYSLLILDDLGIERNTEYSLENLFNVIDARYVSGKAMILRHAEDGKKYLYDIMNIKKETSSLFQS